MRYCNAACNRLQPTVSVGDERLVIWSDQPVLGVAKAAQLRYPCSWPDLFSSVHSPAADSSADTRIQTGGDMWLEQRARTQVNTAIWTAWIPQLFGCIQCISLRQQAIIYTTLRIQFQLLPQCRVGLEANRCTRYYWTCPTIKRTANKPQCLKHWCVCLLNMVNLLVIGCSGIAQL